MRTDNRDRSRSMTISCALVLLAALTGFAEGPVGGAAGGGDPAITEPGGLLRDDVPVQAAHEGTSGEDAHLEQLYATVHEAWTQYLDEDDDERQKAFQVEMADFLNHAVNNYPASQWTLKGIDLYCESRMRAAAEQARRYRNYARSARMLEAVRAYYEMVGVEPKPELVEAINRYDARASR